MRSSIIIAVAAVLSVTSAQDGLVPCAKPCLALFTSGSNIGGCNSLDSHCICSNKDFLNNIGCCLLSKCDAASIKDAISYAQSICGTADPPVVVPDEVTCTSSTAGSAAPTSTTGGKAANSASSTGSGASAASTGGVSTTASESPSKTSAPASVSSGAAMMNTAGGSGIGLAGGLAAALMLL